ncbi:MAG TPA: YetF domain-containing protein [Steroidobacteraceae bacterium]|nr:YetF domain-containing protein [Steroidobacteraceae bacterium]
MDIGELFAVKMPVAEILIRGTAIYWFLFLVFRFVLRRDVGAIGIADVLLLVILADAAQNAMAGEYKTISEGIILLSTIIGWNMLLDWLAYRFPAINRFTTPRALLLVRHGRFLLENLRREYLTREEVMSKLREQGISHLRDVRHAYMESDGQISVMRYDRGAEPSRAPSRGPPGASGT